MKRENAGYEIIKEEHYTVAYEIVLGERKNAQGEVTGYVTWECKNETDYFWGHYFASNQFCEAMKDYYTRLAERFDLHF